MSKITFPPLPDGVAWMTHHDLPMLFPDRKEAALHCDDDEEPITLYTAEQMQERDRQVVERVVRACADRLRSDGLRQDTRERTHAFFDAADAILALLPVKEPQA